MEIEIEPGVTSVEFGNNCNDMIQRLNGYPAKKIIMKSTILQLDLGR